jgi:hypothetical protein
VYVNGGEGLMKNLMKEMYLYPGFKDGTVEYKSGQVYSRPLNYNTMLATIQFINEKNDTLAIANEAAVKVIRIGSDEFIYNGPCLQVLKGDAKVKLYKNLKVRIADIRQVGALGKTNTSAGIESPNQVYTANNSIKLDVNEVLLLNKSTNFYIASEDNNIIPSSKSNVLKLFPDKQQEIRKFIKSKNTDFKKEADLIELMKYASGL